jgi:hypothetical protein
MKCALPAITIVTASSAITPPTASFFVRDMLDLRSLF